jgi:hypothetical protein
MATGKRALTKQEMSNSDGHADRLALAASDRDLNLTDRDSRLFESPTRGRAMGAFKTTLVTTIGAFLLGAASTAPGLALSKKLINSGFAFKSSKARMSRVGSLMARVDRAHSDPPPGYSPLWIAKINGRRIAVYALQNGAKLDDTAGQSEGSADVFDRAGHMMRRFIFRQNLNSPPQITEFVYMPPR